MAALNEVNAIDRLLENSEVKKKNANSDTAALMDFNNKALSMWCQWQKCTNDDNAHDAL